jgi:hypothetical protein
MFHKPVAGLAGIALWLAWAAVAHSQDFHVKTRIQNLRETPQNKKDARPPRPLCSSLFHAGKVYDYNDSGSQVTIFEPAQERFVIVDSATRTSTVVSFEYIDHRLHQAQANRTEMLPSASKEAAGYLAFELNPKFHEKFDKQKKLLVLDSPFLTYQVHCDAAESAELLEKYLNYADWAARLNYVSYRTPYLPAPRLAVDERLRHWGMLPVKVEVQYKFENGPHVQAEHKFTWALDGDNKAAISDWEKMSTARDVKRVAPDELFEQPFKQAKKSR